MPRFSSLFAAAALALTLSALPSQAASFNCHNAITPAERTICGKPTLNILDQRMAAVYNKLLKIVGHAGARDQFRADQLSWLNIRDACGSDATCLRATILSRTNELNGYIAQVRRGG